MQVFLQTFIGGLSLGAIYALVAMGFSIVYRTMGLVNFAHGSVVMVGAYIASTFYLTVALPFAVAMVVIIIEAGFTDPDHSGMTRRLDQLGRIHVRMLVRLVRMDADRRPDVGLTLGDGDHFIPFALACRNAEHARHAARAGAFDHRCLVLDQPLIIEVAVAIDQHQAGSTQRGKTPCGGGSCVPGPIGVAKAAKSRASAPWPSSSSKASALAGIAQRARMARIRTASAVQ